MVGQKVYEGVKIMELANGNLMPRQHGLDAFLGRLLRVKTDDSVVNLAVGNQFLKSLDVTVRQFEKTAS